MRYASSKHRCLLSNCDEVSTSAWLSVALWIESDDSIFQTGAPALGVNLLDHHEDLTWSENTFVRELLAGNDWVSNEKVLSHCCKKKQESAAEAVTSASTS